MVKNNNINKYIISELKKFKFNTTSLGFKYIKYAIEIGIENEELLKNFNNGLYLKIQDELNIDIKWNIEKSIDYMYLNTNVNFLIDYFTLDINQKITPKLFITTIIENYDINKNFTY